MTHAINSKTHTYHHLKNPGSTPAQYKKIMKICPLTPRIMINECYFMLLFWLFKIEIDNFLVYKLKQNSNLADVKARTISRVITIGNDCSTFCQT